MVEIQVLSDKSNLPATCLWYNKSMAAAMVPAVSVESTRVSPGFLVRSGLMTAEPRNWSSDNGHAHFCEMKCLILYMAFQLRKDTLTHYLVTETCRHGCLFSWYSGIIEIWAEAAAGETSFAGVLHFRSCATAEGVQLRHRSYPAVRRCSFVSQCMPGVWHTCDTGEAP